MTPAPRRRWPQFAIAAVAASLIVVWAALHLYAAMAVGMLMVGISLIIGLLVAVRFVIRNFRNTGD